MSGLIHIVGARPNFIKAAPVVAALEAAGAQQQLIHTGQHYDPAMSGDFFRDLGIPAPDTNLEVGSSSHAAQTADVLKGIEPILLREEPDCLLVVGDVNSTVAATLAAVKLGIPVAHVEAGLRSFDREMPEEINRILTDDLSELREAIATGNGAEGFDVLDLLSQGRVERLFVVDDSGETERSMTSFDFSVPLAHTGEAALDGDQINRIIEAPTTEGAVALAVARGSDVVVLPSTGVAGVHHPLVAMIR